MYRFPRHDRSIARGYTLLELIIVLVLMVILLAIVWPSLSQPLQRSTTEQAARQLVEDLARARFNAIQSGRTMVFRYELGGERYWIGPADEAGECDSRGDGSDALDDGVGSESAAGDNDLPALQLVIDRLLEDGVVFQDPAATDELDFPLSPSLSATLADERAETEAVEPLVQNENDETDWSAPVLLYPTGRAENASFVLLSPEGFSATVTLRGLTGALNIGPVKREIDDADALGAGRTSGRSGAEAADSFGDEGDFE
jgi:prepilin-type N-terminal cleavage/methylation domain-containing protein